MPDRSRIKTDLSVLALLSMAIFLAIMLWTFDPADPPGTTNYPLNAEVRNFCGQFGAWGSHLLFDTIGVGAYYLLISLVLIAAKLFYQRTIGDLWLRGIGWLGSLVGICTITALLFPQGSLGPVIGAGGFVGAAGKSILLANFAQTGAVILGFSLTFSGLLLCSDEWFTRASGWAVRAPIKGVQSGITRLRGERPTNGQVTRRAVRDDLITAVGLSPAVRAGKGTEDGLRIVGGVEQDPVESPAPADANHATTRLKIKRPGKRDEREIVKNSIDAASRDAGLESYELPPLSLLLDNPHLVSEEHEHEVYRKAEVLEKTFANFGFNVKVVEVETGPVIAQFEVELEAGLRLSKITGLSDDLAIALRVPSVRIVAPIPGKNTVGIEVPNAKRQLVRLREVIEEADEKSQKMQVPIFLGKDVAGNPMVIDLTTLPHLLIAGRTGTGKSVCLNTLIASMLMTKRPDEVKMLLIDPKMVELSPYKTLPHLMHPVVTDMRKAEAILAWAVDKMEERYALLARAGVRHIAGYNQLGEDELMDRLQPESDEERSQIPTQLPYIIIVADEMADLMMTAPKEVETHIIRLAQKSRAVGIHLVLATQKPTVDVITGLIKSNLPARICFQVASRTDSRVVLDEMGADKLLGNGDMLFLWPGTSTLLRGQGTYVSDEEIKSVVGFVGTSKPEYVPELVQLKVKTDGESGGGTSKRNDDLYDQAVEIVIREGRGSVSLLQRALRIGYGRGARLIDFMAEDGVVGPYTGSQARDVLISMEQWLEMKGDREEPAPARPPSRRKIQADLHEDDDEDGAPTFEADESNHNEDDADSHERVDEASASKPRGNGRKFLPFGAESA